MTSWFRFIVIMCYILSLMYSNHQLPSSASNLVGLQLRLATGSFDDSFDAGTGMLCCVVSSKIKIPKTLSR